MGSLMHPELGLDCGFSPKYCIPRPIALLLADLSNSCVSDKISKLDDIVNQLEDEMKKIDAFRRELPLCMLLIGDAIKEVQAELFEYKRLNSKEPVLEEFIPIKSICTDENESKVEDSKEKEVSSRYRKNWLQLRTSDDQHTHSDTDTTIDKNKKEKKGEEIHKAKDDIFGSGKNRAFVPFKGSPNFPLMTGGKKDMDELPAAGLSLCITGVKNSMEVINPIGSSYGGSSSSPAVSNLQPSFKTARKQRRCWSPELHRKFMNALQHLGGPQAATPKQIREYMQVDGLTNDEVKSHLQKYRLHLRRVAMNSTSHHVGLWASQEQFGESLKQSKAKSGSPEGPLHLLRSPEGDTLEDEDDE